MTKRSRLASTHTHRKKQEKSFSLIYSLARFASSLFSQVILFASAVCSGSGEDDGEGQGRALWTSAYARRLSCREARGQQVLDLGKKGNQVSVLCS